MSESTFKAKPLKELSIEEILRLDPLTLVAKTLEQRIDLQNAENRIGQLENQLQQLQQEQLQQATMSSSSGPEQSAINAPAFAFAYANEEEKKAARFYHRDAVKMSEAGGNHSSNLKVGPLFMIKQADSSFVQMGDEERRQFMKKMHAEVTSVLSTDSTINAMRPYSAAQLDRTRSALYDQCIEHIRSTVHQGIRAEEILCSENDYKIKKVLWDYFKNKIQTT